MASATSLSRTCIRALSSTSSAISRNCTTSTARLLPQRLPSSASTTPPFLLDFLLPLSLHPPLRSSHSQSRAQQSAHRALPSALPQRSYSTAAPDTASITDSSTPTPPAPTTKVLQNPRYPTNPPSSSPLLIDITPRAATRLREIQRTDANPHLALRVTVESGGCHGFQYLMSLTDLSKSKSTTTQSPSSSPSSTAPADSAGQGLGEDEDTVFESVTHPGAKVVMDEPSLELLQGSKIDYTSELIGSQFKIVDNPLATSSCGCGTSFDIKG